MAWTYADFESAGVDDADRLRLARLHMSEVRADFGANISGGGKSLDRASYVQYLADLQKRITELEVSTGSESHASGRLYSDFSRRLD